MMPSLWFIASRNWTSTGCSDILFSDRENTRLASTRTVGLHSHYRHHVSTVGQNCSRRLDLTPVSRSGLESAYEASLNCGAVGGVRAWLSGTHVSWAAETLFPWLRQRSPRPPQLYAFSMASGQCKSCHLVGQWHIGCILPHAISRWDGHTGESAPR